MRLIPLQIESKLRDKGLWPQSWTARAALYVLSVDLLALAFQLVTSRWMPRASASLAGWVSFLSFLAAVLYGVVAFRWLRAKVLWRLRNRLIVTYIFIGVIPVSRSIFSPANLPVSSSRPKSTAICAAWSRQPERSHISFQAA